MVDRYFLIALDHVIKSLCHFSLLGSSALLRLADSSRLSFLILALCLSDSIAVQNLAALTMPIIDGVRLILLKFWAQWIVYFKNLVWRKPNLIFSAATVLLEKPLARFTISESPSVSMSS